jgi:hypothetical protein
MSGAASALYFCGCLFLCCFPTPDPMFGRKQSKGPPSSSGGHQTIVQPVVVNQRGNGGDWEYDEEEEESAGEEESYDEEPASPTRKASMVSRNGDKITDDDFDFDTPTEGTSRVDYKERTLANGMRQVDEITYYPDGTKSIKTKSYDD